LVTETRTFQSSLFALTLVSIARQVFKASSSRSAPLSNSLPPVYPERSYACRDREKRIFKGGSGPHTIQVRLPKITQSWSRDSGWKGSAVYVMLKNMLWWIERVVLLQLVMVSRRKIK
jgi:hypothetical protein